MTTAETTTDSTAALLAQARRQRDAGRLPEAEATCRSALAVTPDDPEAHRLLGSILQQQCRGEEAVASFSRAVSLDPANSKAFKHLAIALSEQGRLAEAIEADRRALALDPRNVGAHCHLARMKKMHAGDPELTALVALAEDAATLPEDKQILLFFAVAKAYDDLGDHARSFAWLERANTLKRSTLRYDVARDIDMFDRIAHVFDDELLDRLTGTGWESDLPVLIVGMPRSGTTLVEQILASHPAVHGAGELRDLQQLSTVVSVLDGRGGGFPEGVAQLSASDLTRLGHGYVERLRRHAEGSGAARVTDKAPMNFRYLGLARAIVPRARVIHCVRDPIDTCVSCYSLLFNGVEFGYDLVELGRYYSAYARLMDHWRRVLPGGWMLEVSYEELVRDVEAGARRIVAHCGLEWDERCLAFHSTERTVRTASFAQVRQPVYSSSVARWRRYEPFLAPLVNALES